MKVFLKALANAAIGGALSGAAGAWAGLNNWKSVGIAAGAGAINALIGLFQHKPGSEPAK